MTPKPVYLKLSEKYKYTTGWVRADQESIIVIKVDTRELLKHAIFGVITLEEQDKRNILK